MKILCIGDSNTYGYNSVDGSRFENPWPSLLDAKVTNAGVNGKTLMKHPSEKVYPCSLNGLSNYFDSIYDLIIICLGSNDLKPNYLTSPKAYYRQYNQLIEAILANNPLQDILLLGLPNIGPAFYQKENKISSLAKSLETEIEKVAVNNHLNYLKLPQLELTSDGIHLSENAHHVLADFINEYLNEKYKNNQIF